MNEIETIFCKLLKCDRASLYLDRRASLLPPGQVGRLEKILQKRINGKPLQYLVGETEFMGLSFKVKPGVLIPRPETEVLVEKALEEIARFPKARPRILDIGTGSGNIAIALAKFLKKAEIHAVDISDTCLSQAAANARRHRVAAKISFCRSDLFSCFKGELKVFDYIVSNPPYISSDEYDSLPLDVLSEPRTALVAEDNGLSYYARIEDGARTYLKAGGMLFLEIGQGQAQGIGKIFSDPAAWLEVKFVKDLCGVDRVAVIKKHG